MLKYLLGTKNGVMNEDTGKRADGFKPTEAEWQDEGAIGSFDLVTTLDFRMSSTCVYSDIVLPTATGTEGRHEHLGHAPFIHPLSAAIDPAREAKSDWEIYKGIAKAFSKMAEGQLGVEKDTVTVPLLHDSPGELAQPFGGTDWKTAGVDPQPGKNCPNMAVVERDYPATYKKFTSLGPLLDKLGNGGRASTGTPG